MVGPRDLGIGFDVRARAGQRESQMDDLTFGDGCHPLESQSAFGQVVEDNWAEIGIVQKFTAPSRMRPAVSLPQRFLGNAWRRGHGFIQEKKTASPHFLPPLVPR